MAKIRSLTNTVSYRYRYLPTTILTRHTAPTVHFCNSRELDSRLGLEYFNFLLSAAGDSQDHGEGDGAEDEQTQEQQEQHAQGDPADEQTQTSTYTQVNE